MHLQKLVHFNPKSKCITHRINQTNVNALMKTNIRIYGYLRTSTDEQDASRAKNDLIEFADKMGFPVAAWFEENEYGAQLHRSELFRLLNIAMLGNIILIEKVVRISDSTQKTGNNSNTSLPIKGLKLSH